MKIVIIGATGATGNPLVENLLCDKKISEIIVFVRKNTGFSHKKLKEIMCDFENIEKYSNQIMGDVFISVLGTTLKDAGSKSNQWRIDYEIPLKFAEIAKNNGVKKCILLSSAGANAQSKVFYSRMKGQLENAIIHLGYPITVIFKPSLIIRPNTTRKMEIVSKIFLQALNALHIARKYQPIETKILAQKMATSCYENRNKVVVELSDIFTYQPR